MLTNFSKASRLILGALILLASAMPVAAARVFPSDSAIEEERQLLPSFPLATLVMKNVGGSPRLRAALHRHEAQKASEFSGFSLDAIKTWEDSRLIGGHPPSPKALRDLNAKLNGLPYRDMPPSADEWQTPLEFTTSGGNCTGYAVAKLIALNEGAWLPSTFLLIVGHLLDGSPHAVVAASPLGEANWYVLDNRHPDVRISRDVLDFVPWFALSFNATWMYDHDLKAIGRMNGGSPGLSGSR